MMPEMISKAAVLKIIFDSVGEPATAIYQKVRELPGVKMEPELPRGCFNCEYSQEWAGALRCIGEKEAPEVRPGDCCESWVLAGSREGKP